MNIVTVKINGVEYNLKGHENEEYLHKVAAYVDKKMKSIMGSNTKLSTTSAAVLSALNVADDFFKSDKIFFELEKDVKLHKEKEKELIKKNEMLLKELEALKLENSKLKTKTISDDSELKIKNKDIEIQNLTKEFSVLSENTKKGIEENSLLKETNKELKFQLQTAKYKIINLQNTLIQNQIDLAKVKSYGTPIIKNR